MTIKIIDKVVSKLLIELRLVGGDNSLSSQSTKKGLANADNIFGATDQDLQRELRKAHEFSRNKYNNKIQIYDIDSETWNIPDVNIKNRAFHNVVVHKNRLYILGGMTMSRNGRFQYLSNTIEVFDIATETLEVDETNPHQSVNAASFNMTIN